MEVVNQILVVGVGVHGFDVSVNAVLIVENFQNRCNRVGGTGSSQMMVSSAVMSSVVNRRQCFQIAFTRSGQMTFEVPMAEVLTSLLHRARPVLSTTMALLMPYWV